VFEVLANSVLPVFAMAALGMVSQRFGVFSVREADTLSRFVYLIPMPILMFRLLVTADLTGFDRAVLLAYVGVEVALYAGATALFHHVFKRSFRESLMLGMATVFANHLLYLLPIAIFRFGELAATEMVTFVIIDVIVIYTGTLVLLDATSEGAAGAAAVAGRIVRNPQILAIAAGLVGNFLAVPLEGGLGVFAEFAGNAAAPASLFALGIVLASQNGWGDWRVVSTITLIKLVAFPLILAGLLLGPAGIDFADADMAILIGTAPSAVASFVLAIRYGVPARDVSMAVLVTTLLSIFSVSVVLQFM